MDISKLVPNNTSVTLNVSGNSNDKDTLLVFDQAAWNKFVDEQNEGLKKIGDDIKLQIEGFEGKIDTAKQEAVNESKKHTNNRLESFKTALSKRNDEINQHFKDLKKIVDDNKAECDKQLVDGINKAIEDLVKDELKKIEDVANKNKTDIESVREDMDFHNNGDIKFCGIIPNSSSDVKSQTQGKDTFLTNYIKNTFKGKEPLNGYFVRCNDGVCFFYMEVQGNNDKWHETQSSPVHGVEQPLKYEGDKLKLVLDTNSGLSVNGSGELTFAIPSGGGFEKYAKKDEQESITATWTFKTNQVFENTITIKNTNGNECGTISGIEDNSKAVLKFASVTDGNMEIIADNDLNITATKGNVNISSTNGDINFNKPPKSKVDASEDEHLVNFKQVKELVKNGNQNGTTPGQPTTPDNGGQNPQPITPDLTDYTKKNVEETITSKWTYNVKPESSGDATDDNQLVNLKQVRDLVNKGNTNPPNQGGGQGGNGGNTKEYTGEGAIEVDNTNNTIKLNVDETTGLKIEDNKLKFEGKNGGVQAPNLDEYTKRSVNEEIDAEWTFKKVPKSEVTATEDHHLVNFKQVKDLVGNGGVNGGGQQPGQGGGQGNNNNNVDMSKYTKKDQNEAITGEWTYDTPPKALKDANDEKELPNWKQVKEEIVKVLGNGITALPEFNKILEEVKKEVDKIVTDGKNDITTQTTTNINSITALGTQTENSITELATKTDEYLKDLIKASMGYLENGTNKNKAEIDKIANEVLDKIRKASPEPKKINTFKTGAKSTRLAGVVYQEVYVNNLNEIQHYGDIIFRGQYWSPGFLGGSGETNGWIRMILPGHIQFDYYLVNYYSIIARPKKGQMDPDTGESLDNFIFVYGRDDKGQLGIGGSDRGYKVTPIKHKFESRVKKLRANGYTNDTWTNVAILENGEAWCCGHNHEGELGYENTTMITSWTKMIFPTGIGKVVEVISSAVRSFLVVHLDENGVYRFSGCGRNSCGILGNGEAKTGLKKFKEMTDLAEWKFDKAPEIRMASDYYNRGNDGGWDDRAISVIRRGTRLLHAGVDIYNQGLNKWITKFQDLGIELHRDADKQFWINSVMIAALGTYNGVFGIHMWGWTEDIITEQGQRYKLLDTTLINHDLINDEWEFLNQPYQHTDNTRGHYILLFNKTKKRLYITGQHSMNNSVFKETRRTPLQEINLPEKVTSARNLEILSRQYGRDNHTSIHILADEEIYAVPIVLSNMYNQGLRTATSNTQFNSQRD